MKNKSKCDAFAVDLGKQATGMFLPVYSHHRWHFVRYFKVFYIVKYRP